MTVADLIAHLSTFDQDLTVLTTRYSDLRPLELDDIELINATMQVSGPDGWLSRVRGGSVFDQKPYLHFDGN